MFVSPFVLLIAFLTVSAIADPCDYVNNSFLLPDSAKVKECFDTFKVPQDFVDSIYRSLELIGDFYPYVDINRHPPDVPSGYFKPVDYYAELENLKQKLNSSDNILSKVVRPTQEFIAKFRDGHFSLYFYENTTKNPLANVYAYLPFSWNLQYENDTFSSVHIGLNQWSATIDQSLLPIIARKVILNTRISQVDGQDAYAFFTNFFGVYNNMKSRQGSLQYSRFLSQNMFPVLMAPLDDDMLFKIHTLTFEDGYNFNFSLGFLNRKNAPGNGEKIFKSPIESPSIMDELRLAQKIKSYKPKLIRNRDLSENEYVKCARWNNMNYMSIGTFSGEEQKYVDELVACIQEFDTNTDPISVVLPMNGGGYLVLEELLEFLLMPNTEHRMLVAARKTDASKHMAIDWGVAGLFADMSDSCHFYKDLNAVWEPTVVDHFGNVNHTRTAKYFIAFKEFISAYAPYALKNVRKPTDIIVATDGFCFSACSVFVLNTIRKGAAIVTGFGSTNPGDNLFVAAQCPSSVLPPAELFDELKSNFAHGIQFQATYLESYNISQSMNETTPGDFEVMRIDKHLGYDESVSPIMQEFIPYLQYARKEFQTTCNPLNKRLFLVNDSCTVEDPNALTAGHPCGADGKWDKKQCKISTCKMGYVVDFENNKCVEFICDPRLDYSPSSSSSPSMPILSPSDSGDIDSTTIIIISVVAFVVAVVFVIILLVVFYKKKMCLFRPSSYDTIDDPLLH